MSENYIPDDYYSDVAREQHEADLGEQNAVDWQSIATSLYDVLKKVTFRDLPGGNQCVNCHFPDHKSNCELYLALKAYREVR